MEFSQPAMPPNKAYLSYTTLYKPELAHPFITSGSPLNSLRGRCFGTLVRLSAVFELKHAIFVTSALLLNSIKGGY